MIYLLIGLFLFVIGFSHKLETINSLDFQAVKLIQNRLGRLPFLVWFEEVWVFGRTAFTLVILLFLTGYNWKLGLSALSIFGIVAGLELVIKSTFNRTRPYSDHKDIQMLQPREPTDPSFPSGDALRIWFLILILVTALGNNPAFGILSVLLAVLVTMGRLIFGVHYLTDVLAGIGLGFLAAGTTIWLWQSLHLL